ncbi:MAG: hypothetical protein PHS14_14220 [Elusimicrobia bacterium]|nr:hypothetical protein [Elusimicrobiota bacterium]
MSPLRVPEFQASRVPGGAVPLRPVDAGTLLNVLDSFAANESTRAKDLAVRRAGEAGLLEGGAAAEQGRAPVVYAGDTEAEQLANRAARAAYVAGLENDWADTATRLANEHPLDPDAYQSKAQAAIQGSLKGLDAQTAEIVKQRAEGIFAGEHRGILNAVAAKGRADQGEALKSALARRLADASQAERSADVFRASELVGSILNDLEVGQKSGLLPAAWAETMKEKTFRDTAEEGYFGEIEEAEDPKAALDAFKKSPPLGMDPRRHEALVNRMESWLKDKLDADVLQRSQEAEDSILTLWGDDPAEALAQARAYPDPKVREKLESGVKARLDEARTLRDRAEDDRVRGIKEQVVALAEEGKTADALKLAMNSKLSAEDSTRMEAFVRNRAEGSQPIMGPEERSEYRDLRQAYTEDPKAFLRDVVPRLSDYRAKFDDQYNEHLLDLVDRAKREVEADEYREQAREDRAQAKADRAEAKAETSAARAEAKKNADALKLSRRLEQLTNRGVSDLANRLAPKATAAKRREMLGRLKDAVEEWRFGGWEPTSEKEVTQAMDRLALWWAGGDKNQTVEDVPPTEVPAIRDALERAGRRATPETIADVWAKRPKEAPKKPARAPVYTSQMLTPERR